MDNPKQKEDAVKIPILSEEIYNELFNLLTDGQKSQHIAMGREMGFVEWQTT